MRLLIVSSTCSASKYQEIYNKRYKPMLDSNQKFFLSLIDGLNENREFTVDCISALPISHSCYPGIIIRQQRETVNGVSFSYCGCINYPIIRTLTVKHNIYSLVKRYIKQHNDEKIIVLCDGLIAEANALINLLRKEHIPSIALVTDVPDIVSDMSSGMGLKSLIADAYGKYATKLLQHYDRYVFLTEQMNEVCNPNNHPFMIMECIVTPVELQKSGFKPLSDKPVVLYAGKLHSDFGVLQLAKAAALLNDACEIWLYGGNGNCDDTLKAIAKDNLNLKIHGIVPLSEIHYLEQNADILINPRPCEKEFTKYSFPSKTAEYMMMEVPIIMHHLAGIPEEYDKYLFYLQENTPQNIADNIKYVLSINKEKKNSMCREARKYIIEEKNNLNQAHRLMDFINS